MRVLIAMVNLLLIVNISMANNREYILKPIDIKNMKEPMFFCYGREWWYDSDLKVKKVNNILFIDYKGGKEWEGNVVYPDLRTFPEEVGQPPIYIKNRKYLIIELDEKFNKKIFFKITIDDNKFNTYTQVISIDQKKEIKIPLPKEGKSINYLQIQFIGEPCLIGIKSIYLE